MIINCFSIMSWNNDCVGAGSGLDFLAPGICLLASGICLLGFAAACPLCTFDLWRFFLASPTQVSWTTSGRIGDATLATYAGERLGDVGPAVQYFPSSS